MIFNYDIAGLTAIELQMRELLATSTEPELYLHCENEGIRLEQGVPSKDWHDYLYVRRVDSKPFVYDICEYYELAIDEQYDSIEPVMKDVRAYILDFMEAM